MSRDLVIDMATSAQVKWRAENVEKLRSSTRDERLSWFEADYYVGHSEVLKKLDLLIQYLGVGHNKTKVTP